jgi:ribonuclease HI
MDSELVIRQLIGRYRVRNPRLQPLWGRIAELRRRFASFQAVHVPRTQNQLADALANRAFAQADVDVP